MGDVARLAGVSLGTVSNVLNSPSIVAAGTRDRVQAAIDELGFVRNRNARSLASGRADTVGFVVIDLANSFFVDIARGAEKHADENDYRLLLADSHVDLSKQNDNLELFEEYRVSGALLAPFDGPLDAADRVREHGLPVVYVNWPGKGTESCGVVVDEQLGGYLATRHLLDTGRRQLMFIGGPMNLFAVRSRYDGAMRAVSETAGATLELLTTDRLTVPAGRAAGARMIASDCLRRSDGVVAAADALASGLVQSFLHAGIEVPGDIAVIGYDNNHFASDHIVPISTVGQPGFEMGMLAAELLLEEIKEGANHVHRTITLQPELIVRASTTGRQAVLS